MLISKLTGAAVCVVAAGALIAGAGALAMPQERAPAAAVEVQQEASRPDRPSEKGGPDARTQSGKPGQQAVVSSDGVDPASLSLRQQLERRRNAALEAFQVQRTFYESGTITIDRLIEASRRLMDAERDIADSAADRLAAIENHVKRAEQMVRRERARLEGGANALPTLAEAALALEEARSLLAQAKEGRAGSLSARSGRTSKDVLLDGIRGEAIPPDEADLARNRGILEILARSLSMPFANETPLEDVIKYIANETVSPTWPVGLPIYVDPEGLKRADVTPQSPVVMNLENTPLKTSLRLLLKQLGLGYMVKDGLLVISDLPGEAAAAPSPAQQDAAPATRARVQAKAPKPKPDAGEMDDRKRNAAINEALNKRVPMDFQATPIEKVIETVKKATVSPELPDGIPIYVDPEIARDPENAGKTLRTNVTLKLDGVRLKMSLRLIVSQLGLTYDVSNGLLVIARPNSSLVNSLRMEAGFGGFGGGFR